jgi:hypothetical protein
VVDEVVRERAGTRVEVLLQTMSAGRIAIGKWREMSSD